MPQTSAPVAPAAREGGPLVVGSAQEVTFFRNFNRVVALAFAAIMLLTIGFFAHQVRVKHDEELAVIAGHVARQRLFVEFVLRSSMDHLDTLRRTAQAATLGAGDDLDHPLRALLADDSARGLFHLDALPERDLGANLTGLGSQGGRDTEFDRDVHAALSLNTALVNLLFQLPSAAQAGMLSAAGFSAVYPWVESTRQHFDPAVYAQPLWQMGGPARNLRHEPYWAPVQNGGSDVGWLVPAGAPLYRNGVFRGVVWIATSLDYLNRINGDFGYGMGTVMLVDAQGTVLAHPELARQALQDKPARRLTELVPTDLQGLPELLPQWGNTPLRAVGEHWVMAVPFDAAPWHLVYVVPRMAVWQRVLADRAPGMLAMLLGLAALIVVMYGVVAREFVGPAAKLVQHLANESRFQPQPVPVVPYPWRPWFDTVSRAFRESMQLMAIRQELDIAATMQRAILPHAWPQGPGFELSGLMRPAKEVGGDFYDHFSLGPDRLGLVVADVSGKGVPAALFGMVSKTLFRATATQAQADAAHTVAAVNDGLCQDNDSCMFVTAFYAEWHANSATLSYVNAGHPPPLWVHADGHCTWLPTTGDMALGVMDGMPYTPQTVTLQAGDAVVIYTDGVTEAMNAGLEEFGPQRLAELFDGAGQGGMAAPSQPAIAGGGDALRPTDGRPDGVVLGATATAVLTRVVAAVDAFAGAQPQSDDITCVVLRCRGVPSEVLEVLHVQ